MSTNPAAPRPLRATVTALTAVVLLAAGYAAPAASAAAAKPSLASCYASSCTGKDPNKYTCSQDVRDLDVVYDRNYATTLRLRYSPSCRAVWAREDDGSVGDYFWVRNSDNNTETQHIHSGTSNRTYMVNDKDITAAACLMIVGRTTFTCTGWH
ncbi:DUF2690 domain-containing protein [Streptomyces sp. NPDC020379]|uniref:DUF2690 domain-containing protein n=1 Tax=Streptomyces sp. NPDC020379 TaxID=3365071 RepID=UPI00379321A1